MSKHIIDWKELYRKNRKLYVPSTFNYWQMLNDRFGNNPIDEWDLILFALSRPEIRYNVFADYTNLVLSTTKLAMPRGNFFATVNDLPPFHQVLQLIKKSTYCHTAYAVACCRLIMYFLSKKYQSWSNTTIGEYNGKLAGYDIPRWLNAILDRQKKLAIKAGLGDNDPLFFVFRYEDIGRGGIYVRSMKSTDFELLDLYSTLEELNGIAFSHVRFCYKIYAGLEPGGVAQNVYINKPYLKSRKKILDLENNLIGVYEYKDKKRLVYDFGYCLAEIEKGIYLVNGTKGIYLVPHYLITQPVVRAGHPKDQNFKDKLPELGYANADFYATITTHRQLIGHKVKPHKLKRK